MMLNFIINMNKKSTKIILQNILARSSHQSVKRFNTLQYSGLNPMSQLSDQAYMDKTLSKIYCDFLMEDNFRIHSAKPSKLIHDLRVFQHCVAFQLNQEMQSQSSIEEKLIQQIKKLDQPKKNNSFYFQLQNLISEMTIPQAQEHKKYLMYIYRWVLNQKGKKAPQIQQLDESLQRVVMLKLKQSCSAHLQQQKIESQLKRIERLSKAREYLIKGDRELAKNSYQLIFENQKYEESIRLQALQYLCRQGIQNKDRNYLLEIRLKIKENGSQQKQIYMQHVQKALKQVTLSGENSVSPQDYIL